MVQLISRPAAQHTPLNARRAFVLALSLCAVLPTTFAQPVPARSPSLDVLLATPKWVFAYTGRMPLDPLETWNQFPATIKLDGDKVILEEFVPYLGTTVRHVVLMHPEGIVYDNPATGPVLMKLDAGDAKAPFKGRAGSNTYWLLRAPGQ